MDSFRDTVAVITGAGSGIGRASALSMARLGAAIVVADVNETEGPETVDLIQEAGGSAVFVATEVSRADSMTSLRDQALSTYGRVDVVMNNVGVIYRGRPEAIPAEVWQRHLEINLMSVVRSNEAFLPLLIAQGSGHVINTASFAGLFPYSYDRLSYAAGKAAIVALSEGLALYLRPQGIGVTLLCPGPVLTNIARDMPTFGPDLPLRIPGDFALLEPPEVGEMVAQAVLDNRFFLPTHPEVRDVLVRRASDWDGFIAAQTAMLAEQD